MGVFVIEIKLARNITANTSNSVNFQEGSFTRYADAKNPTMLATIKEACSGAIFPKIYAIISPLIFYLFKIIIL